MSENFKIKIICNYVFFYIIGSMVGGIFEYCSSRCCVWTSNWGYLLSSGPGAKNNIVCISVYIELLFEQVTQSPIKGYYLYLSPYQYEGSQGS